MLALIAAVVAAFLYKQHVIDEPGEHIERDAILAVIAQESPVLYSDAETRIGVFFAMEHRQYVPYSEIPEAWVDAIIAAEDEHYFEHPGVDWRGISRAMIKNAQAGRVVAGGSTLTQQTAKNLFYRPDRSLRSKLEEALNALRLERHHSKEDILEFYANQFHVSANGRGLGIAARYFFDKDVDELDTLECAFIAGLVKAPAYYNPFVGTTEERRAAAVESATVRTRYVLDRMLEIGKLDAASHAELVEREIPFKRGTFRYDTSILIDEVAHRLERAPFPELFEELGIDNPSTAGIQVITTLDVDAQREATYGLWHHLTEVGPLLEGHGAAGWRLPDDKAPHPDPHQAVVPHTFKRATVAATSDEGLTLDLGGPTCLVDGEGLKRAATVLARARKGEKWRTAKAADLAELREALPVGAVVLASLRTTELCDLELRPDLQGGLIVLEDGLIRAMVGGNDNRNFNRAVSARRQLGSTWKPVLYHAALQLGWTPVDPLDNRRNVFPFEGSWYYPRPDHQSEDFVSLAWAGTRSENLSSIWLLYHLTDRLGPAAFSEVADLVGLGPAAAADRDAWIELVRDDYGVISTRTRLPEIAYYAVRSEVAAELPADHADRAELPNILFGHGVGTERARAAKGANAGLKLRALSGSFVDMEKRAEVCLTELDKLRELSADADPQNLLDRIFGAAPTVAPFGPEAVPHLRVRADRLRVRVGCVGDDGAGLGEPWQAPSQVLLDALASGGPVALPGDEQLQVAGGVGEGLELSTLRALRRAMARRMLVMQTADPYDFEVVQYHPDFRVLVGMRYMAGLARRLGVKSELPPVLSMPLGAVDVTLEEAATLYQGLEDGQVWGFPGLAAAAEGAGEGPVRPVAAVPDATLLIQEIRDREGNVLYRAEPVAERVIEALPGRLSGDILRNVVKWGTGRRAARVVTLGDAIVPVTGKTGTTNSFRNAAFVGFVPKVHDGAWHWGEGFTIAAYVGYDDNREMRRGSTRLAGASGALPAWIGAAQGLATAGLLGEAAPSDPELAVDPALAGGRSLVRVPVLEGSGLPLPSVATGTQDGAEDGSAAKAGQTAPSGRTVLVAVEPAPDAAGTEAWRLHVPYLPTGASASDAAAGAIGADAVQTEVEAVRSAAEQAEQAEAVGSLIDEDLREVWVDEMAEEAAETAGGGEGGPLDFEPLDMEPRIGVEELGDEDAGSDVVPRILPSD